MKKTLIVIVLLTFYSNIFAFISQGNWRWRNDDGTETTAGWKAGQNAQPTLAITGETWRLRMEFYNTAGATVGVIDTLQYALSTSGPWTNIDTIAGSKPFVIAAISSFVVQAEPTSEQLTGMALTFSQGKMMVDSMLLANYSLPDQRRTEFEWAIRSTSNIIPNTTYYFRQWGTTANVTSAYPSLITAGVLAVRLTGFTVNREDKKIRLEWVTNSEANNDRFEIQRSSDGKTWKTIAGIAGHGSNTLSSTYKVYDESPLSGMNYYMIKQYNSDGHFYFSQVKFLKMPESKSILSVYPNPAHSAITFSVFNKTVANVEAVLADMNGNIIHRETFKSIPANIPGKLNMQHQPAPGVYILKLNGKGFSESSRVVVE
jgi:hypothetical protein